MATTKKETEAPAPGADNESSEESAKASAAPRKIPGNLPYLPASGTLKKALDRSIEASRPEKFNADFLENVLKLKGGSARATIPILKRLGFLTSDGTPTDVYARFRTDGGRSGAAYQALKIGFPEIFKRSEYAHSVDDNKLRDIILEITGLKASDPVAIAIKSTFNAIKSYIAKGFDANTPDDEVETGGDEDSSVNGGATGGSVKVKKDNSSSSVGLVYNINIVLPETSDLRVLNAIFKSLKDNLL